MNRRAAWLLIALCAWTLWVWLTFMWIIGHQSHPIGFKVVHGVIAVVSMAFGLAAGRVGYRALRGVGGRSDDAVRTVRDEMADREGLASR
jgi:hypothetical protein